MKRKNLKDMFLANLQMNDKVVERFVISDLQDLLTLLISIYAVSIIKDEQIPAGFSSRFEKSFNNVVLGNLIVLISWLVKRDLISDELKQFSLKLEKQGVINWLKKLVEKRNQLIHPKEKDKNTVLEEIKQMLKDYPDFLNEIEFEYDNKGELYFLIIDKKHKISPFAYFENGRVKVFKDFKELDDLEFEINDEKKEFPKIWKDVRLKDKGLENPKKDEFIEKAKLFGSEYKYDYEEKLPKWIKDINKFSQPCLLVEPSLIDGILKELKNINPVLVIIDVNLKEKISPLKAIFDRIGISDSLTSKNFINLISENDSIILVFRANDISSNDFLKLFYWIADLKEQGSKLRIFISRDNELLEKDNETIWERFPGNIDDILALPYGSKGEDLKDYLWNINTKKKFFIF